MLAKYESTMQYKKYNLDKNLKLKSNIILPEGLKMP